MSVTSEKHGDKVRLQILNAGLEIWPDITPSSVARAAGMKSHAAVLYHFPRNELKNAIAEHAIATGHSRVIIQLIARGHPATKKMSLAEKRRHFTTVSTSPSS